MNHKAEVKVKELKITRGFSMSRKNLMALREESLERTIATEDGSTVSVSEVLDEIVTGWRERKEKDAALEKSVGDLAVALKKRKK